MEEKVLKKRFQAVTSQLESVNEFISYSLKDGTYSAKALQKLKLIAEEVFVNIVSYAYTDDSGVVDLTVTVAQNLTVLEFCDFGIEFNPLKKELPDVTLNEDERQIGGLGIFFVRKFADDVKYSRKNNSNVLTITKRMQCGGSNEN